MGLGVDLLSDRGSSGRGEAERVSIGIDEYPEPVTARLVAGLGRAERHRASFGLIEIVHDEVQVHLGWRIRPWPGGWFVMLDALEIEPQPCVYRERNEGVVGRRDRAADQALVEPGKLMGIRAVDGDGEDAHDDDHAAAVARKPCRQSQLGNRVVAVAAPSAVGVQTGSCLAEP